MYYIVKSNFNWADEIDFEGFDLFTGDELERAKEKYAGLERDYEPDVYIGTNESVAISAGEVLDELMSAEEISREAFVIISKKIGVHFGFTKFNLLEKASCGE